VLLDGGAMLSLVADVQDSAMNLGVKSLHAAIKHLRETGEIGDIENRQPGFAEGARCATCRYQLNIQSGELFSERNETGLVGHTEKGAAHLLFAAQRLLLQCLG